MSILCTFPGKFGDLLWALPSIRALARRTGEAVDLLVAAPFASICPLIEQQPYIGRCRPDPGWLTQDTAPITPRVPNREDVISPYAQIFHLGYRAWPERALPFETLDCLNEQYGVATRRGEYVSAPVDINDWELHLETPWITTPDTQAGRIAWCYGFTDEHFELKYGLVQLLTEVNPRVRRWARAGADYPPVRVGGSPRWTTEADESEVSWGDSVTLLRSAGAFLGDNSALHVLAVASGTPVVMMEPNPTRHHFIFYPLGTDGPQVTLVRGNDGLPTWDARHVRDTLTAVLARPPLVQRSHTS